MAKLGLHRWRTLGRAAVLGVIANAAVNAAGIGESWAVPATILLAGAAVAVRDLIHGIRRIQQLPTNSIPRASQIQVKIAQKARHKAVGGALLSACLTTYAACLVQVAAVLTPGLTTRVVVLTLLSTSVLLVVAGLSLAACRHLLAQSAQLKFAIAVGFGLTLLAVALMPFRTNVLVVAPAVAIVASFLSAFVVRTFLSQAVRANRMMRSEHVRLLGTRADVDEYWQEVLARRKSAESAAQGALVLIFGIAFASIALWPQPDIGPLPRQISSDLLAIALLAMVFVWVLLYAVYGAYFWPRREGELTVSDAATAAHAMGEYMASAAGALAAIGLAIAVTAVLSAILLPSTRLRTWALVAASAYLIVEAVPTLNERPGR